MFSQNLSVLAFSVCILLTMANTSYGYLGLPRQGRSDERAEPSCCGYLGLPRQGRSDERAEPSCCGMPLMKATGLCPIGMECCPGLKKVLQKSGQKTVYSICIADLY
uniref:Small cardioactive peptide n=1 Tax=Acanthosepion pharaonis TaxID=158019 RepID=A0A7T3R106_ACAPH|nr:small cardioactive peptide [Sepia pharaonis]